MRIRPWKVSGENQCLLRWVLKQLMRCRMLAIADFAIVRGQRSWAGQGRRRT